MDLKLKKVQVIHPGATAPLFAIRELEIPAGSRLLIRGRSGRGKTTLLHLMAGLFVPAEGTVIYRDSEQGERELSRLSDEQRSAERRKNLGIIFQKLNLLDHLTAAENIRLALPRDHAAHGLALRALERVGMKDRADDVVSRFSLGEQQRVAVARVLAAAPRVILADEPTSSLDADNAEAVISALLEAAGEKGAERTLVVVSHDARLEKHFSRIMDFQEVISG